MDVGIEQDERQVLGIDDRGIPLHVHDVLEEGRPEDEEGVSFRAAHHRPFGLADDLSVKDLPLVEVDVPLCPHPKEELFIVLWIEEDDALAFGNRLGHLLLALAIRSIVSGKIQH